MSQIRMHTQIPGSLGGSEERYTMDPLLMDEIKQVGKSNMWADDWEYLCWYMTCMCIFQCVLLECSGLSVCVSVCLSVCVPVFLSVCLYFVCLSLSACLPACQPACLPVCLPACLSVCLSAYCHSVCPSVSMEHYVLS